MEIEWERIGLLDCPFWMWILNRFCPIFMLTTHNPRRHVIFVILYVSMWYIILIITSLWFSFAHRHIVHHHIITNHLLAGCMLKERNGGCVLNIVHFLLPDEENTDFISCRLCIFSFFESFFYLSPYVSNRVMMPTITTVRSYSVLRLSQAPGRHLRCIMIMAAT